MGGIACVYSVLTVCLSCDTVKVGLIYSGDRGLTLGQVGGRISAGISAAINYLLLLCALEVHWTPVTFIAVITYLLTYLEPKKNSKTTDKVYPGL